MTDPDRDLREQFDRLRSDDARGAPSFVTLLDRVRNRAVQPRERRLGPALAVAGAVVLAALLVYPRRAAPPSSPAPPTPLAELRTWRAPTDFLLDTPGHELLGKVPTLGSGLPGMSLASPTTERSLSP